MNARRIFRSGNSLVVTLPTDVLVRSGAEEGDGLEFSSEEVGYIVGRVRKKIALDTVQGDAFKSIKDGGDVIEKASG